MVPTVQPLREHFLEAWTRAIFDSASQGILFSLLFPLLARRVWCLCKSCRIARCISRRRSHVDPELPGVERRGLEKHTDRTQLVTSELTIQQI